MTERCNYASVAKNTSLLATTVKRLTLVGKFVLIITRYLLVSLSCVTLLFICHLGIHLFRDIGKHCINIPVVIYKENNRILEEKE